MPPEHCYGYDCWDSFTGAAVRLGVTRTRGWSTYVGTVFQRAYY